MSSNRYSPRSKRNFDWITLWVLVSLLAVGWLMIFAVEYREELGGSIFNLSTSYGKQLLWLGISSMVIGACLIIHADFWKTFSFPIFIGFCFILALVPVFGQEIKGSQSWFTFGFISVQPGELAKFPTVLALASFISYYKTHLARNKSFFTALGIIGLPVALIMLQPDAGTALIYAGLLIVLYRFGANPIWFIIALSIGGLFISSIIFDDFYVILSLILLASAFMITNIRRERHPWMLVFALVLTLVIISAAMEWYAVSMITALLFCLACLGRLFLSGQERLVFILAPALVLGSFFSFTSTYAFDHHLKPHQQDRINVWLQPHLCDPHGSLYNVLQSKLAIGSGGLSGKGFLEGTMTKLNYVPEQNTDFIFVTVGEEQGFIGGVAVIVLYCILLIRIFMMGERMTGKFEKVFAYGVGSLLFIHFSINIGMTMGLMPVIGIPLPFMSYGGSSLLGFSLMMGVLLKLDYDSRNR